MSPATAGPAGNSAARAREHLLTLLTPLVERAGYDLEEITVSPAGRRSVVRVVVDADAGIDLDAVALVSRLVSDALDGADARADALLAGAYTLEVTSPGVDRPLTEPRHWRRAIGRLVQVEVGGRSVVSRVRAVDDRGVTLESPAPPATGPGHGHAGWAELGRGRVQVEFSHADGKDDDTDYGTADDAADDLHHPKDDDTEEEG